MLQAIEPWYPLIVSAVVSIVAAGLGGWLTRLGPWYRTLKKPTWQPPDWLFGPVWTVIFCLGAGAAFLAWRGADTDALQARVLWLFGINVVLNVAWSGIFFRMQRPDLAFLEVLVLWVSILSLIVGLWSISSTASLLLVPYLIWVSFAAYLNLTIVRLNPRSVEPVLPAAGPIGR